MTVTRCDTQAKIQQMEASLAAARGSVDSETGKAITYERVVAEMEDKLSALSESNAASEISRERSQRKAAELTATLADVTAAAAAAAAAAERCRLNGLQSLERQQADYEVGACCVVMALVLVRMLCY